MGERPYTVLSCGVSLDGYLDNAAGERLILSNGADLDRVDEVRSSCDAILVGASTIRRDNPRLLIRAEQRRHRRVREGMPATPAKVTLSATGRLDPESRFFTTGACEKFVYCASPAFARASGRFRGVATVVDGGSPLTMRALSEDLYRRGIQRLMVEGGGEIHTQFLAEAVADELHVAMAPLFVGDSRAPRFVGDGRFQWKANFRAPLMETRVVGDVVLMRYALSGRAGSN